MAEGTDILQHSDGSDVGDDGDNDGDDGDGDADYVMTAACNIMLVRMNIS